MYLVDFQLRELCERHGLVEPFDPARINPASIDLALGRDFVNLSDQIVWYDSGIGAAGEGAGPGMRFRANRVRLKPGVALLASTAERVVIPDTESILDQFDPFDPVKIASCVAELRLKSSAARNGLDHALAGWIDPGFGCGLNPDGTRGSNLTLELHAHRPIELIAGKCYVQLVVATTLAAPTKSYQQTGRYIGEHAIGAVLARGDKA